jgi:hypothetical protein
MVSKVKLKDLFTIEYDETDNTQFILKVKPTFSKRRIRIFTDYGTLDIHHTFKDEEWFGVDAFPLEGNHANAITLRRFEQNPHNEGRLGLIIITKSKENKEDEKVKE